MKLVRRTFLPTGTEATAPALHARLKPGLWLVEAGCVPPPAHRPSKLMGRFAAFGGMGVSLRTATVLDTELGTVLADRLRDGGCALGPLAGVALHEILVNAAVHGNLQVSSGPAAAWPDLDDRAQRIAEALHNAQRAARLVTVVMGWNAQLVQAVVIDEGGGDDAAAQAACAATARTAAGRGRLIARAAARVDVLRGGRCTRLLLNRVPAEARA